MFLPASVSQMYPDSHQNSALEREGCKSYEGTHNVIGTVAERQ